MPTAPAASALAPLKGLLPAELAAALEPLGAPRFAARQLQRWLYARGAASFDEMTDLSRALRAALASRFRLAEATVARESRAADGTIKLLVELSDGARVESVVIPEDDRVTLCLSSQVGCARGCLFCATARMGLTRNLTAGEIVDQAVLARRYAPVTNVVFMGMGEPLDNFDQVARAAALLTSPDAFGLGLRHVTVSTVGVVPHILRLARERVPVRLTVSLTAPLDELRSRLMPVNRAWPITELVAAVKTWSEATRREPTLAYVLLRGVNDAPAQAVRLAGIARELRAKVNLIPFNAVDGGFERPPAEAVVRFQAALKDHGVLALLRRERGGDIAAACGQLALQDRAEADARA